MKKVEIAFELIYNGKDYKYCNFTEGRSLQVCVVQKQEKVALNSEPNI